MDLDQNIIQAATPIGVGAGGGDDQGHHGADGVVQGGFGAVQERQGRYSLSTVTSLRGEPGLALATVSIV